MREHSSFRHRNKGKGQEKRQEMGVGKGIQGRWESLEKTQPVGWGEWWRPGHSHILPVPHEMSHQGPTFKPQEAKRAARQSWASRASCATQSHPSDGCQPAPTLGTLCSPGHLPSTVQSCPHTSLLCLSRQSDRLSTWIPSSAPRSPLGLDTGSGRNATRQVCANTGTAWSPSVFSLVSKIGI